MTAGERGPRSTSPALVGRELTAHPDASLTITAVGREQVSLTRVGRGDPVAGAGALSPALVGREPEQRSGPSTLPVIAFLDEAPADDPGAVVLTCANCGAAMDERKCKLICRCGYFLSCSDYY